MREQLIKFVEIIPIEFVIRNVAQDLWLKDLGIEDGTVLKEPLIEYCLKMTNLEIHWFQRNIFTHLIGQIKKK